MERKDYAEKFRDIKDEILDEIRGILGNGEKHYFKETFFVHYVEGEVATTEVCSALEISEKGMVVFHVINSVQDVKKIEAHSVYAYDPESFLDILEHLQKDIREKKLSHLREIVKKHEGTLDFDGTLDFILHNSGDDYICQLTALRIAKDGKLEVDDICDGDKFTNPEDELSDKDLDNLIEYVRSQTGDLVTLTEKQENAVQDFIAAYNSLKKLNVRIIRNNDDDRLYFLNGEKVEEFISADIGSLKADYAIDVADQMLKNTSCEPIVANAYYSSDNEHIYAKPFKS